MPHKNPEKAKAYRKEYKTKNKEKIAAYQKEYMKGYMQETPRQYKSTATLEWAIKRRDLSPEDFKQWQIDKRNKNKRDIYARNKGVIDDQKSSYPCSCGESDIRCLEFHHRDPSTKKFAISEGKNRTTELVKKEMDKCDVLCKNCHMKIHRGNGTEIKLEELIEDITNQLSGKLDKSERRRLYRNRQKYIAKMHVRDYKIEHNCKNCGEEESICLVFHHRDGVEKEGTIPQLYKYGIKKVSREIDKCDLICHNCHSKHHN